MRLLLNFLIALVLISAFPTIGAGYFYYAAWLIGVMEFGPLGIAAAVGPFVVAMALWCAIDITRQEREEEASQ